MAGDPQGVEEIEELVMVFVTLEQQKMARLKEANQLASQIRVRRRMLV